MTVSTTVIRTEYAGDGTTTAFATTFPFMAGTELQVWITDADGVETRQTITTHYTVSGGGGSTGTVTMVSAPASGETLTLLRTTKRTQEVDLTPYGPFPADTVERMGDRLQMQIQELQEQVGYTGANDTVRTIVQRIEDIEGIGGGYDLWMGRDQEEPFSAADLLWYGRVPRPFIVEDDAHIYPAMYPAPAADFTASLYIGDTPIGSVTVGAGLNTGTATLTAAPQQFNAGDLIRLVGPGTPDAEATSLSVTIKGRKG